MIDLYIFGFGLVVTILVGTALGTMIVVHNRRFADDADTQPVDPRDHAARPDAARPSA
ncbi:MAG: hypothetical protein JNM25_07080 [Planctomycetes bacterium]|nr:hypothetical protein [Planctomycetota bacterium]